MVSTRAVLRERRVDVRGVVRDLLQLRLCRSATPISESASVPRSISRTSRDAIPRLGAVGRTSAPYLAVEILLVRRIDHPGYLPRLPYIFGPGRALHRARKSAASLARARKPDKVLPRIRRRPGTLSLVTERQQLHMSAAFRRVIHHDEATPARFEPARRPDRSGLCHTSSFPRIAAIVPSTTPRTRGVVESRRSRAAPRRGWSRDPQAGGTGETRIPPRSPAAAERHMA